MIGGAAILSAAILSVAGSVGGLTVEVEKLQPRHWAGATVRPVLRVSGVEEGEPLRGAWALVYAGRVVRGAVQDVTGPSARELEIELPTVTSRIKAVLELRLFRNDESLAAGSYPIELFPPGTLKGLEGVYTGRKVGIVGATELTDAIDSYGRFELAVNARVAGPRLGKDVQAAIKAVKAGDGVVNPDGTLTAGPAVLQPDEYSSRLVAADPEFTAALPAGAGLVVLDQKVGALALE